MRWFKEYSIKYRSEIIIFVFALALRLLSLVFILWREQQLGGFFREFGAYSFPLLPKDSSEYFELAKNLLNFGRFSLSSAPPLLPDSMRTPVYPAFLAAIIFIFKSTLSISMVQNVLGALSVVLFYKTARKFFSDKISKISALVFSVEPTVLYFSNVIASEQLFIFLFMLALFVFLNKGANGRRGVFLISGFILGLAILTRPLIQFLPLLFMAMIVYWGRCWGWRKIMASISLFLLGIAITVFPWSLRNKITFDSWQISPVGAYNFYNYYVPMFLSQKYGLDLNSVMQDFKSRLAADRQSEVIVYRSLANAPYFMKMAGQEILKDPASFSRFYLIKAVPFFISDGLRDISRFLEYIGPPTTNLTDLFLRGNLSEMTKIIFRGNLEFNLFMAGFTFWLAVTFFMAVGALRWIVSKRTDKIYGLFIILLIFYFFIASGPIANGRFRLPVIPWMVALALYGIVLVGSWLKKYLPAWFKLIFRLDLKTGINL
ncbi:MAG: glycosyltransferase family 39 protein [bacterium]|nr:glycosyltransferase family 39 protein [bacterium]